MKKYKLVILVLSLATLLNAQVENVPLSDDVYNFLKEMKVKNIIENISDDNPNLSRDEVCNLLLEIEKKSEQLNIIETERLTKFKEDFFYNKLPVDRKWEMFGGDEADGSFSGFLSDRQKQLYVYQKGENNLYLELIGKVYQGQELTPNTFNTTLYGGGLRMHGTLFGRLGYHTSLIKGMAAGHRAFAETIAPWLNSNFKWIENIEKIGNYDFVEGYLKYAAEPADGMKISVQLGREPITFGYGYGDKLVLTNLGPSLDFLKVNFSYGMIDFTSLHASTVGEFDFDRSKNYTKYYALNRIKFMFDGLFDLGFGESVVYSGRSLDLGYLNPFIFYKFVEMSLQDRDNGTFHIDFQTKCFNNFEIQGTFFLDENVMWRLSELDKYVNKTAYQLGAFWYEAFAIDNLSMILEYTRTRPYINTHNNPQNTYTSFDRLMGHRIGGNADEIFTKLIYNISADLRVSAEYRKVRSGKNVVDVNGNVIKNVGSDAYVPWREGIDNEAAVFLDGIRTNNDIIRAEIRWEPIRDIIFDLIYNYNFEKNITLDKSSDNSYLILTMELEI